MQIGIGQDAWGGIGRKHTLALRALPLLFPDLPFGVSLAAVATRNPQRNGEWIRRSGYARVVENAAALIADPAVDVVDIVTPNALHPEIAQAAWAAGKPVYCEKPIAANLAGAKRMVRDWREASAVAPAVAASHVALVYRFWPAVARAKDLLAEGRLGQILTFRGRMVHGGYLDPNRPYDWRLDQELAGGGALADLGIHLIDLVQFLLGPIGELTARTRTFITERPAADRPGGRAGVLVDDWGEITCTLESGAVGTIEATRAGDGQEETVLEIFGSEGSLKIHSADAGFPQWFDRRRGEMHTRGGFEPGPYTQAVLGVWPPARSSLGSSVDAHLASLLWWLWRVADPARIAALPQVGATIEDGLAAQTVLARAYTAARR